jgi:hypothetical protein
MDGSIIRPTASASDQFHRGVERQVDVNHAGLQRPGQQGYDSPARELQLDPVDDRAAVGDRPRRERGQSGVGIHD